MDIRYCDHCGDVVQNQLGATTNQGTVQCGRCAARAASKDLKDVCGSVLVTEEIGRSSISAPEVTEEMSHFTMTSVMDEEGLDLYSPETISLRKKSGARAPHSAELDLGAGVPSRAIAGRPTQTPDIQKAHTLQIPGGSRAQSGQAAGQDRWRIECLHCQSQLTVRPVAQRSRMRCPRCTQQLILDTDATVRSLTSPAGATASPQTVASFDLGAGANAKTQPFVNPAATAHVAQHVAEAARQVRGARPSPAQPAAGLRPAAVERPAVVATPSESAFLAKAHLGEPSRANALLGGSPATALDEAVPAPLGPAMDEATPHPATAAAAPARSATSKHRRTPVESMVMWLLIASVPTLTGLYLASELAGTQVQDLLAAMGSAVEETVGALIRKLAAYF